MHGSVVVFLQENRPSHIEGTVVGGRFVAANGMEAVIRVRFAVQIQVEAEKTCLTRLIDADHRITVVHAPDRSRVLRIRNAEAFAGVIHTRSSGDAPLFNWGPFFAADILCAQAG